jgi:hypothetical protein
VKRAAITALAAVSFSLVGAVVDAEPAAACSCVAFTDADAMARADAVFVGRVAGYAGPQQGGTWSSADPALWRFAVSHVYKGEVRAIQDIVSEVSGASCGLEIPKIGEFLVFATVEGSGFGPAPAKGQLYAGRCGGTRSTSEGLLAPELAAAHRPLPAPPLAPLDAGGGDGSTAQPWIWVASAAVGVGAGGLVLALLWRRRTRAL